MLPRLRITPRVALFAVSVAAGAAAITATLGGGPAASAAARPATSQFNAGAATTAPEFTGIDKWLNSDPLTLRQLRGKVVLVDFWTFTCINCIHVLPYVKTWNQKYKDQGLVVVGVHTPEYPFERNTDNVESATTRFGITFPVAQDNDYATWRAYDNQYWPAFYLVDKNGRVAYTHFGEGDYEQTEAKIKALLAQNP
ncbi:thioredoxin family protein [Paraburkholderia fungorum]|uniref:thioredoxin family protein n=1 Tax=Paraburkholderia fungorum TaxID=134537 RepID=UPI002092162C|nr:thioredoxin family protein [Paraburkholderia fungorum]USU18063.1 thioredoxin family protein [Paraburkholderia fungorum]USU26007.1 thioredoxin family protein [Paraburkholderia fungorum]